MSFQHSVAVCLRNCFCFSGRASRSEFWWFFFFLCLVLAGLVLPLILLGFYYRSLYVLAEAVQWVVALCLLFPYVSVSVRRLHDTGRGAWWLLLLVPPVSLVGLFFFLRFVREPGEFGSNRYGYPPGPGFCRLCGVGWDYGERFCSGCGADLV